MGLAVGMMFGMNITALLQDRLGLTYAWLACGAMQLASTLLLVGGVVAIDRALTRQQNALANAPKDAAEKSAGEPEQPEAPAVITFALQVNPNMPSTTASFSALASGRQSDIELEQRLSEIDIEQIYIEV